MNRFAEACRSRDFDAIAEHASNQLGIEVTTDHVAWMFANSPDHGRRDLGEAPDDLGPRWCGGSWIIWIKNRVESLGLIPGAGGESAHEKRMTVELHMFSIYFEETPVMLRRLQGGGLRAQSQVARSKVFSTNAIPAPINNTAARVSDMEKRS